MFGLSLFGGFAGGLYGSIHDLCTYSISPEYFTRLKFDQFSWADVGFPPDLHAAEIGFIATGVVGMMAGWFLARIAVPVWTSSIAARKVSGGFLVIFGFAIPAGLLGSWLGGRHTADYSHWEDLCYSLGVLNVPDFVRVAYVHDASYLGGFVGLVMAVGLLRSQASKRLASPPNR